MRHRAYFVAGTDTGVGKTLFSTVLLQAALDRGLRTAAVKPVAAGCEQTPEGLRNDDALRLQAVTTEPLLYEQINPIALKAAIAPHIAAARENRRLSVDRLAGFCRGVLGKADLTLVEGAGGWRVPLNAFETLADLARVLQLPVILVVGIRLGCINHALLTAEAIRRDGLTLAGWVANHVDPEMPCQDENVATLEQRLGAPCLGRFAWREREESPAAFVPDLDSEQISALLPG